VALLAMVPLVVAACGASTPLLLESDLSADAATDDSSTLADARARPDAPTPGACEDDLNTDFPSECSGTTSEWLAWPYVPTHDFSADSIELYTTAADVAVLEDAGGMPGAVLFEGPTATSASATWVSAKIVPPVVFTAGHTYFLAELSLLGVCSVANDGIEYMELGAASLTGPWTVTGTDAWTAKIIGVCD